MKLWSGNNPGMSETPLQPPSKVHVVRGGAPADTAALDPRAEPLHISYSSTRVSADAGAQLQRTHGIVGNDRSPLAESFRMLRNQVLQRMRPEGHRLLAVTSARRIEGKSITAANLALTLAADFDTSVMLVDADLSGTGLQHLFGLAASPGLGEHLLEGIAISELLVNPGIERLVVLPAGRKAVLNSSELLATRAAQQLFTEMKARYQDRYIVVDLPPLLDTADALAFLPQVDTTLVVVEEHTTSLQDIESVGQLMTPFNLVGTVMSPAHDGAPGDGQRPPWYRRWRRGQGGAAPR